MKRVLLCMILLLAMTVVTAAAETDNQMVITLEGTTYTMPCSVAELAADGWMLQENRWIWINTVTGEVMDEDWEPEDGEWIWGDNDQLYCGDYMWQRPCVDLAQRVAPGAPEMMCYIAREDGKEAIAYVKNLGAEECAVSGCSVVLLAVAADFEAYRDMELTNCASLAYNGLVFGETELGTLPDWAQEGLYTACDVYTGWYEAASGYGCIISARFDGMDEDAEMLRMVVEADYPELYRRESLNSDYAAPENLAEDWCGGTVTLDGKLYQMPIPITEMLKDGWNADIRVIRPYDSSSEFGFLEKEGKRIQVHVCFDEYDNLYLGEDLRVWMQGDVVILECTQDSSVDVQVGPFRLGMTEEEMLETCRAMYGEVPAYKESGDGSFSYYVLYNHHHSCWMTWPKDAGDEGVDGWLELKAKDGVIFGMITSYNGAYGSAM